MRQWVVVASLLGALSHPSWAAEGSRWELVVLPIGGPEELNRPHWPLGGKRGPDTELFWIGLKNASDTPRAFCRLGIGYEVALPDGTLQGTSVPEFPGVRSVHRCGTSMWTLVLPGQTYFVTVKQGIPAHADKERGMRFHATAEEEPCHPQSWSCLINLSEPLPEPVAVPVPVPVR